MIAALIDSTSRLRLRLRFLFLLLERVCNTVIVWPYAFYTVIAVVLLCLFPGACPPASLRLHVARIQVDLAEAFPFWI
jgi:hypothetical protein